MSIILFLIILSVLVVAHEFGHFWAAKRSGMRVDEFGLGFPPKIKTLFYSKGTAFTLNWLPFGGFVRIFGENPQEESTVSDPNSFASKSLSRRLMVLVAGVVANFLLAWVLFSIVLMLGIDSTDGFVQRGLFGAIYHGLLTTGKITWLTLAAIWQMFASLFHGAPDFSSVVGPVGLVSLVGTVKSAGLAYVLYFMGIISINLSIVNLIPIPALDGGRVLIVLIEHWRGKDISHKAWNMMSLLSFLFLILLMVIITVHDVRHLL